MAGDLRLSLKEVFFNDGKSGGVMGKTSGGVAKKMAESLFLF